MRQLEELLQRAGHEVVRCGQLPKVSGRLANPRAGYHFAKRHGANVRVPWAKMQDFGGWTRRWEARLRELGPQVMVLEDTRNYPAIAAAANLGIPLVSLPQNLESFYDAADRLGVAWPDSMVNEFGFLSLSAAVFTISREEQLMLRLRDIPAEFLPFYPSPGQQAELQPQRQARASTAIGPDLLLLGTAGNHMTAAGMIEAATWLAECAAKGLLPGRVRIAGFGTESIREKLPPCPQLDFLGAISEEQLAREYATCRAIVAHQFRGVGALTRIPEALLVGIPILANGIAARSYMHLPDVFIYDSAAELARQAQAVPALSALLPPPAEAEQRFLDALERVAAKS